MRLEGKDIYLDTLERCGLTLEGRERQAVYLNGAWQDRLLYAILEDEYQA